MAKFSVGQIVQFKSGGPKMTVLAHGEENADGEEVVVAGWFNNSASENDDPATWTLEQTEFPVSTLTSDDDE